MTGVLNAMVGQGGGLRYTVTIGVSGTIYGYLSPSSVGSIAPSDSFRGTTIVSVYDNNSGNQCGVTLLGVLSQSFFTGIEFQTTAGGLVTFYTAAATHSDNGVDTFWNWPTSSDFWTSTTPATRMIRIF